MMKSLNFYELAIPFKLTVKHHSAERSSTQTVWVEARGNETMGCGEGCPRPYVTGENIETATNFYHRHGAELCERVRSLETLRHWMETHKSEIDQNPAAWCAVELAVLELLARNSNEPVEKMLSLAVPAGRFRYSAVIGDSPPEQFGMIVARYAKMGFTDFKIKLSGQLERDREKMSILNGSGIGGLRVRADANNLWKSAGEALDYLTHLNARFSGIEEPVGAGQFDEMRRLAKETQCSIILDESLIQAGQISAIAADPEHWIINVRVSKMGGLLRSLDVVSRAREAGIPVIVGAHVGESSLLARAAMTVAQAAGDNLFAQEGAFGTYLLESDVVEKPLMFGPGGVVDAGDWNFSHKPGWGLDFFLAADYADYAYGAPPKIRFAPHPRNPCNPRLKKLRST
jgi:L-alanine-DL-glutamate epimerase-like enolase superfamily enzyme